ncbi:hypothetical protein C5F44_14955 [Fuscovulum blasticum DSM 2131]|uniref:HTH cro/C1-type domain-containing protein n=1 Tax=Fuscovulum blasticum DSM 2131 TaxID=1188250 RepID=A0A2T4J5M9_FUSBL|nr:hypothetical protein C5F44_14955 [Fuscovulum blasticum DSM 2131]
MPSVTSRKPGQPEDTADFAENIRHLVSRMPSIAEASKRMGINRQQLNKYLNGSSVPSLRTMRRIATLFNIPIEALTLPLDEFGHHIGDKAAPDKMSSDHSLIAELAGAFTEASEVLKPYCGRYFRYNCVPQMPKYVLRTYAIIFQRQGVTQALVLERFAAAGTPWSRSNVRRTRHLLSYVQDRIQFIDCGTPAHEVTPGFALFYPVYTSGVRYLSGVLLSNFGFGARPIYSSNIVMQRRRAGQSLREDLAACGLMSLDDPALGPEVRERLCFEDGTPALHLAG